MNRKLVILYSLLGTCVVIAGIGLYVMMWYTFLEKGLCVYHNNNIQTNEDNKYRGEISICYYSSNFTRELKFYRGYQLEYKYPEIEFLPDLEAEEDFVSELEGMEKRLCKKLKKGCRYNPKNHDHYIKFYNKTISDPWNYDAWLVTLILSGYFIAFLGILIIKTK